MADAQACIRHFRTGQGEGSGLVFIKVCVGAAESAVLFVAGFRSIGGKPGDANIVSMRRLSGPWTLVDRSARSLTVVLRAD